MMAARSILSAFLLTCSSAVGVPAQSAAIGFVIGGRTFDDGTGMATVEARGSWARSGWRVRPTLGLAGSTDLLSGQLDVMVGASGDVLPSGPFALEIGGGVAHLRHGGGEYDSGVTTGVYVHGGIFWRPRFLQGVNVGVDVRYFNAPSFERADGLMQDVDFLQFGLSMRGGIERRE